MAGGERARRISGKRKESRTKGKLKKKDSWRGKKKFDVPNETNFEIQSDERGEKIQAVGQEGKSPQKFKKQKNTEKVTCQRRGEVQAVGNNAKSTISPSLLVTKRNKLKTQTGGRKEKINRKRKGKSVEET